MALLQLSLEKSNMNFPSTEGAQPLFQRRSSRFSACDMEGISMASADSEFGKFRATADRAVHNLD
jgi:hypothetical protein